MSPADGSGGRALIALRLDHEQTRLLQVQGMLAVIVASLGEGEHDDARYALQGVQSLLHQTLSALSDATTALQSDADRPAQVAS